MGRFAQAAILILTCHVSYGDDSIPIMNDEDRQLLEQLERFHEQRNRRMQNIQRNFEEFRRRVRGIKQFKKRKYYPDIDGDRQEDDSMLA